MIIAEKYFCNFWATTLAIMTVHSAVISEDIFFKN